MSDSYGFGCQVPLSYADAISAATVALKAEGFGVLTEIDVKATLKAKIDADYRPYVILGACNPNLAYKALTAEPGLGLLLPCNVIVYDNEDGTSTINIVNPLMMLGVVDNAELQPIADEANARLRRVVDSLSQADQPA